MTAAGTEAVCEEEEEGPYLVRSKEEIRHIHGNNDDALPPLRDGHLTLPFWYNRKKKKEEAQDVKPGRRDVCTQ